MFWLFPGKSFAVPLTKHFLTVRDPGKCPYFSKEIVHTTRHKLTLNFVKAMKNDEYVSIFKQMEFVMHTKL